MSLLTCGFQDDAHFDYFLLQMRDHNDSVKRFIESHARIKVNSIALSVYTLVQPVGFDKREGEKGRKVLKKKHMSLLVGSRV